MNSLVNALFLSASVLFLVVLWACSSPGRAIAPGLAGYRLAQFWGGRRFRRIALGLWFVSAAGAVVSVMGPQVADGVRTALPWLLDAAIVLLALGLASLAFTWVLYWRSSDEPHGF